MDEFLVNHKDTLNILNNYPTNECSCKECREMCIRPCWGTPEEISILLDLGFAELMMLDYWEEDDWRCEIVCPAENGKEGDYAGFIPWNGCVLQDDNGLCKIHNICKPIEARLHTHIGNEFSWDTISTHERVMNSWRSQEGLNVVKRWKKLINFNENEEE